ncbi:MAG: ribulokinase [Planctomycetota bacterium]
MAPKYAIGIDFGTESGRAVLVDVATGEEKATAVHRYANGVIDEALPDGKTKLAHDWALQDPADYIETMRKTIPAVLREGKAGPEAIIGVGIDFTACTMLPIDAEGAPLCQHEAFRSTPNAWVKLWKHHAAQPEADLVNEVARRRGERWLRRYGGKISSEWFFPKALQTLVEAPEVYRAADRFLEGADWVVLQLCGEEKRNACTAGYKAIWDKHEGYPSEEFFAELHPEFRTVVKDKLSTAIYPQGTRAGGLTKKLAKMTGLREGLSIAVANVDAHVAVPALTVVDEGKLAMIMGTSVCHLVLGKEMKFMEGQCGVVEDGIIPGWMGFEAGQCAVGDIFAWFVEHCVPESHHAEARRRGIELHALLEEKASKLRPGETGLLALDWHNGNRSVLVDAELSGLVLGLHLNTRAEEIYRALIESTAFGTYKIIRSFESAGVAARELYCCGGLAERNELLMQTFSDVTGREMRVSASGQTPALGSAMFASVAAGRAAGGYDTIEQAAERMAKLSSRVYRPDGRRHELYEKLYAEYETLHDYFGRGTNDVMKRLRALKSLSR